VASHNLLSGKRGKCLMNSTCRMHLPSDDTPHRQSVEVELNVFRAAFSVARVKKYTTSLRRPGFAGGVGGHS
jgi:hypothetical protein